jgi:hypothetical protein
MQLSATIAADAVNAHLARLNSQVPIAQRSGVVAGVSAANRAVMVALMAANHLPDAVLGLRVKADDSGDVGKVWVGENPVKSDYLSSLTAGGTGAYAGGYYFNGAFIVDKNGNNPAYLARRMGRGRHPLESVATPPLSIGDGYVGDVQDAYLAAFLSGLEGLE